MATITMRISRRGALKGLVAGVVGGSIKTRAKPEPFPTYDDEAWRKVSELAGDNEIVVYDDCPLADEMKTEFQHVRVTVHLEREMLFEPGHKSPCLGYISFPIEVTIDIKMKPQCGITDTHISPEAFEDIKNWGVDQIDDATRKEILRGAEDTGQNIRKWCLANVQYI